MPSWGQWPTHCFRGAFPGPRLFPPLGRLPAICVHLPGPTHVGRSREAGRAGLGRLPSARRRLVHAPRMDNEPESTVQKSRAGPAQQGSCILQPVQHLETDPVSEEPAGKEGGLKFNPIDPPRAVSPGCSSQRQLRGPCPPGLQPRLSPGRDPLTSTGIGGQSPHPEAEDCSFQREATHPSVQHTFAELLLCARDGSRCWGRSRGKKRRCLPPRGVHSPHTGQTNRA